MNLRTISLLSFGTRHPGALGKVGSMGGVSRRQMFEDWYEDDRHWREEQSEIYTRKAHCWKPFNAYLKRMFGGKHFVLALFQVGLTAAFAHNTASGDI